MLKRFLNGRFGDLIEYYAAITLGITANCLLQVPGNGLSLTVQVRRQINGVSFRCELFELVNHFFLTRQNLVVRFPIFVRIDTHSSNELVMRFLFLVLSFFLR